MQDRIVIRSQRHGGEAIRTSVNIPRKLRQWLRTERDRRRLSESAIVTEALRVYREIVNARTDAEALRVYREIVNALADAERVA